MIRRAGQILNETVSGAQKLDLGGLEQLLPHLLSVPGLGAGSNTLGTAALNSFLRQGGVDLNNLGLPGGVGMLPTVSWGTVSFRSRWRR